MNTQNEALRQYGMQGDKLMSAVQWLLFVFSLGLAGWYDTWTEALVIGLSSAAVPTILTYIYGGTRLTRAAHAAAFMVFSALHIHQAHGMIEMHFGIFVLLAFLLYYRDWVPVLTAAAVIAVHHVAFFFMQQSGYPVFVFTAGAGFNMVVIHAAYVVFETGVLIYLAVKLRSELVQSVELLEIGKHLVVVDGRIDLAYRKQDPQSRFAVDFNNFIQAIHDAMRDAKTATDHLATNTAEMQNLSSMANQSMQEQSQQTDLLAAAINEMTATVQEVARNANEAAQGTRDADEAGESAKQVVGGTIKSIETLATRVEEAASVIDRLEQQSDKIGVVLEVIKSIADQTNLLALNAAIEAARAGEQGRGFAVVADEVRTLAGRTQESTEEIQQIIEQLQSGAHDAVKVMEQGREQAQEGVNKAGEAGKSLNEIASAIALINDMNIQIASAAEQQSHVAEEINKNVVSISSLSQQAAEHVARSAASSNELEADADRLHNQLHRFNL